MPGAQAQEAAGTACVPDTETLEVYRADGTLAERQAYYESLSLNLTDPGLIAQAQAQESGSANLRTVPPSWKTGMGTTGDAKILLIRVDFPDYSFSEGDTEDALKQIAFVRRARDSPATLMRASRPIMNVPPTDSFIYPARLPATRLQTTGIPTAATWRAFLRRPMTALDAQGMDFSQFDGNNDGLIDGVYIHFAGPDTGWGSPWWSQKAHYAGAPFVLDGVALSDYVTLHDNSASGTQTLIHETGHMLGLADYYSYTSQTYENGIRTFDMMCDNTGDHNGFFPSGCWAGLTLGTLPGFCGRGQQHRAHLKRHLGQRWL